MSDKDLEDGKTARSVMTVLYHLISKQIEVDSEVLSKQSKDHATPAMVKLYNTGIFAKVTKVDLTRSQGRFYVTINIVGATNGGLLFDTINNIV